MKLLAQLIAGFSLLVIASSAPAQMRPYIRFDPRGAAFSADTADESNYTKQDGTQVHYEFTGKLFRDSHGRTRMQQDRRDADHKTTYIIICDPVRKVQINLNSKLNEADVFKLSPGCIQPSHPLAWDKSENLGTKEIEGYVVAGMRSSGTGPGALVDEDWFSADLMTTLDATVTFARGKSSFHVSNIRAGDPDPSVFEIPEGYTIRTHN